MTTCTNKAEKTGGLAEALLQWYDRNRRELPWRDDPSPYHVWISEIMLQQTRVEAVKGYYARFLERFPDIRALAEAGEDECLKLWEGLGYYSRARNLQRCARQIMEEHGGKMPQTSRELKKLSGIGPYAAAAIASIAFGEAVPAIDGNLLRIFARLTRYEGDIKTPAAASAAAEYFLARMPEDRPGDFNQALMDLGSALCLPGTPACEAYRASSSGEARVLPACPLQPFCTAFRDHCAGTFPVMPEKKPRKIEKRTVLVIREGGRILLRRRPPRGLLAGLYEFPNVEGWLSAEEAVREARDLGCEPVQIRPLSDAKHVFTHKEWHMRGYEIRAGSFPEPSLTAEFPEPSIPEKSPEFSMPGESQTRLGSLRNPGSPPPSQRAESPSAARKVSDQTDRSGSPGTCFFASIRDLREIYAVPGAFAAYMPGQERP